jgi:hypothetical protein
VLQALLLLLLQHLLCRCQQVPLRLHLHQQTHQQ